MVLTRKLYFLSCPLLISSCLNFNDPSEIIYPIEDRYIYSGSEITYKKIDIRIQRDSQNSIKFNYREILDVKELTKNSEFLQIDIFHATSERLERRVKIDELPDYRDNVVFDSISLDRTKAFGHIIKQRMSAGILSEDTNESLAWRHHANEFDTIPCGITDPGLEAFPGVIWQAVRFTPMAQVPVPPLPHLFLLSSASF